MKVPYLPRGTSSSRRPHVRGLLAHSAALLGVVLTLLACDAMPDAPTKPMVARAAVASASFEAEHIVSLDELFLEINSRAPGFAGFFWKGQTTLVVQATARGSQARIAATLREVLPEVPWPSVKLEYRTAAYDVNELMAVRERAQRELSADFVYSDFDESANVIVVGLDKNADLLGSAAQMRALGVRDGTLRLEHADRPVPAQNLGLVHRPVVGGVITTTHFVASGHDTTCTLGANVHRKFDIYHEYFLTAGHCTATPNAFDGSPIYQPSAGSDMPLNTPIGYEDADPPLRSGIPGCVVTLCRYSEVALFKYTDNSFAWFTYLAKTAYFSTNPAVNGSADRVGSFHVVNDISDYYLTAPSTVLKVGGLSGWTSGTVDQSCINFSTLVCQYRVAGRGIPGDSGSPVFQWICCGLDEAWLGGILVSAIPGYYYYFSSITGIKNDIAGLRSY